MSSRLLAGFVVTIALVASVVLVARTGDDDDRDHDEKQPGFCRVMLGSSFRAEGLSAESADTAIANIEDALATDPPDEIADALREIEHAFERVADGADPGDVGVPFATLTRYTVDRCGPFRVTTTLATQGATP